jgi:hypothetical protein
VKRTEYSREWGRGLIGLAVAGTFTALVFSMLFVELFATRIDAPFPWATASDLEPTEAPGEQLLWIVVDAMNADMAFNKDVMPFVASHKDKDAAWGLARTGGLTLTGPAVWTLGTGRTPSLGEAVENFAPPPADSDNLFRRLHEADFSVHLVGEAVWSHRYGQWADQTFPLHDRGLHDTHESDDAALWAGVTILENDNPDVLVVHFVGADHVGHEHGTVGVNGPYAKRLREIDDAIKELVTAAPETMAVLVMADHGMTDQGGHGGGEEKPRNAPFVWWGPGVIAGGPTTIDQTAVAPTLAAYLGVPPPAEAESEPESALLTFSEDDTKRLARNTKRQRQTVTGNPKGELPRIDEATSALAWTLIYVASVLFLIMVVRLLLGASTKRSPFLLLCPMLVLIGCQWTSRIGIGEIALIGLFLTVVLAWTRTAGQERWHLIALVALLFIVMVPMLRWWSGHILFYAGLLALGVVIAAIVLARRVNWESSLFVFFAGAAIVGLLAWTHGGLDIRQVSDSHWGLIVVGAVGIIAVAVGGGTPAGLLLLSVIGCRLWPIPWLESGSLIAVIPLLTWLASRKNSDALIAGVVLATGLLFGTPQFAVIAMLALCCAAASRLPTPKTLGAWLLLAPLVVTLLEVVCVLALGKEYTFSSVQVALAFVGGTDLNLVRAVALVSLADILPWCVVLVSVGAWAAKSTNLRVLPATLGVVLAMYPLRLLGEILIYEFIRDSFWLTSSVLPFMAATLVLMAGMIPVVVLITILFGGAELSEEE